MKKIVLVENNQKEDCSESTGHAGGSTEACLLAGSRGAWGNRGMEKSTQKIHNSFVQKTKHISHIGAGTEACWLAGVVGELRHGINKALAFAFFPKYIVVRHMQEEVETEY